MSCKTHLKNHVKEKVKSAITADNLFLKSWHKPINKMNLGIALSENNNKKRTTYNEQPANYSEAETYVISYEYRTPILVHENNYIQQLIQTSDIMVPNLNPFVVNIPCL